MVYHVPLVYTPAVGEGVCLQLLLLQEQRLQQQGRDSWSGRGEIRLVDNKLVITGKAPAPSGHPVIILGFVVNSLACVKYWTGQR